MAMNQDENILLKISEQCDQKDYESAKNLLVPYLKQNPNHGEANFLMVRVLTQDYTLEKVDEDFEQNFQVALIHANEKQKKEMIRQYNRYIENLRLSDRIEQLTSRSLKKTLLSNFFVFLLSFCIMIGIILCFYEQMTTGLILIGVAILLGIIQYLLQHTKK